MEDEEKREWEGKMGKRETKSKSNSFKSKDKRTEDDMKSFLDETIKYFLESDGKSESFMQLAREVNVYLKGGQRGNR